MAPGTFTTRTVVVSRAPSAAATRGTCRRPAAPANARLLMKPASGLDDRHWKPPFSLASRLQLAFELVEEAPIGVIGDNLVGIRLDQSGVVHAQGIESDSVLGVVVTPFVVGELAQRLQGVIVSRRETAIDQPLRYARRLVTQRSAALRTARRTRFVATGCFWAYSREPASMQQKYCDQGRSTAVLTITWPA